MWKEILRRFNNSPRMDRVIDESVSIDSTDGAKFIVKSELEEQMQTK